MQGISIILSNPRIIIYMYACTGWLGPFNALSQLMSSFLKFNIWRLAFTTSAYVFHFMSHSTFLPSCHHIYTLYVHTNSVVFFVYYILFSQLPCHLCILSTTFIEPFKHWKGFIFTDALTANYYKTSTYKACLYILPTSYRPLFEKES